MSFDILLVSKKLKGGINNLLALGLHPPVLVVLLPSWRKRGQRHYCLLGCNVFAYFDMLVLANMSHFEGHISMMTIAPETANEMNHQPVYV